MRLFIIMCIQFFVVNLAHATNNNLNGNANFNNNKANAEINAGYISDTTVNNSTDIPVSGAYAPLNVPTSDCLSSISAGGQGQFFGFSFGATTQSKPCNIREYAKMFRHMPQVANAILCQDDIVRNAFEATDYECPTITRKKKDWIVYEYPNSKGR